MALVVADMDAVGRGRSRAPTADPYAIGTTLSEAHDSVLGRRCQGDSTRADGRKLLVIPGYLDHRTARDCVIDRCGKRACRPCPPPLPQIGLLGRSPQPDRSLGHSPSSISSCEGVTPHPGRLAKCSGSGV